MAFVLSFVPHKSTKTPQNKRFMAKHSFFTGQNSTFANAKQCSAKDLIGSKVFLDIIFSGFVPFLSRMINSGERQKLEVIENKRVTIEEIGRNAVTTSNHQNGPCEPVKVASVRNSLVWNITSSISSSRMLMPKSLSMLSAICSMRIGLYVQSQE